MPLPKTDCDAPGSLFKATLKLVNNDPKGLLSVQLRTGVPLYWLRKFASGKIPKPNSNRIQHIYEKMTGIKILPENGQNENGYARLKNEVLKKLGGICAGCGESDITVLTVDHVDQKGAAHRKKLNIGTGRQFYSYLKRNNYPDRKNLRILCCNCQARAFRGTLVCVKAK